MSYPFPADLQEFVRDQMATGRYQSEDELVREAFRALDEADSDLRAVREAIAHGRQGTRGWTSGRRLMRFARRSRVLNL